MAVGSPFPCQLVWQASVSFLWVIWIYLCLQGTLSQRSSCEHKGQKWEASQEGAGVFLKGQPECSLVVTQKCVGRRSPVWVLINNICMPVAQRTFRVKKSLLRVPPSKTPKHLIALPTPILLTHKDPEVGRKIMWLKKRKDILRSLVISDPRGVSPQLQKGKCFSLEGERTFDLGFFLVPEKLLSITVQLVL